MSTSELRKDIVSGEWVVIAPKRAGRPTDFIKKIERHVASVRECPFEHPEEKESGISLLVYPSDAFQSTSRLNKRDRWRVQIIRNKYPAFQHERKCSPPVSRGLYEVMEGVGYHHLLVTRDHRKNFSDLSPKEAFLVFQAFAEHYRDLARDRCVQYISFFQNWGSRAGASVYHPHYQIIALPIIPPDISRSLQGALRYYKKHKECVHCAILRWESKEEKRIIYESKNVVAFCPFVSRESFEVRIFPKKHIPHFEDSSPSLLQEVSLALQKVLYVLRKKLKDPDYNFFLHSAPVYQSEKHGYYHWHFEVMPKMSISAGFELGTGIEVTVVDPDDAAKLLRLRKSKS
ncbi:MAG: HIT domain-containing protein [Nanoarchaeota archaeon]|nr:HIT domain-containing protein [Nanoarchaeota archaeon]